MDYLRRRERRRLAEDLINQQIIDQVIDLERQREDDFRRQFQSIIYDVKDRERQRRRSHSRSHSQNTRYRDSRYQDFSSDLYDNQLRHRSGSLSQQRSHHHHQYNESKECCLITLTYKSTSSSKHGDEIMIIQHNTTVFKGCLQCGDQLTFKSKRYRNDSKLKFNFYINDLLEDEIISCCEHELMNRNDNKFFHIERIIGSKPCHECQSKNEINSLNSSSISSFSKSNRISTENHHKTKPPVSLNNRQRINEDQKFKSINHQKLEKKKPTLLSIPKLDDEKAPSEGFSADISELSDSQTLALRYKQKEKEEDSNRFLPILSSTDRESPPPTPKPIYGPPQLSTMLSVTETLDSQIDIYDDIIEKTKSLNIQQKKDSDSDNDENNHSNRHILQFLQSISSSVENNQNGQRITQQQISSMYSNSARNLSVIDDATQSLLTRLGIVRQQQNERCESSIGNSSRQKGNVEYFILVYLNSIYPDELIIKHLRGFVNFLKIFDDIDDCIAFINSISNEKILFILSNKFQNLIISRIEDLQQIYTIYILYEDNQIEENLLNKQTKIKGFYTDINLIYKQISIDINEITRDLIAYMNISSNSSTSDQMFIYSYLISEIILDKEETENAMKELINFSRQEYDENEEELLIIDEFQNDYQKDRAIWWFTRQCFLSKMLNKALRTPEADILFKLRLFIQDLYHQIENESVINTSLTVYLGQTIHQNDLEDLQKILTNNGLLVFSQFLYGSTDLLKAITIAKNLPTLSDDYIPVILHLNISSNMKCANTSSLRYIVDDNNDVLLNMGIIGRLTKIEKDNNNQYGITSIYLTIIKCENEQFIENMIDKKRNEIKGASPFVTLIKLMITMNQQIRAEQLVQMIFDDNTLKSDLNIQGSLAASYHILGAAYNTQGDFKHAVELFHLSLESFLRFVPSDAVQLSPTYNNIGSMYFRQENYLKAAEYHQKALDVQLNSHNPNLNSIASYSNNVGVVQLKQGKYNDAIKSFDRALKILQQINQLNDPDLASTYDNLADAYLLQDKYDDALTYYTKALDIQRLIQPHNPQALASFNNSIGNVYNKLHRYADALVHFKRALEYQQEYLPTTHPSYASLYNNIGSMYYRQEQYADALPHYLKSLEIELMSLPENHPTIAVTHFNIATTYTGLGRFQDAIISTERSIEQLLKTLPSDHPEVIENQTYIETIKRKQILKELFNTNTTNI